MFLCAYIPDFPAEAIVRAEPELRQQAIAIVQGVRPLITVVAINDRARAAGVEIGSTEMQAEERFRLSCEPQRWHIRQRSLNQEASTQAALLDCACSFSPRVEVTTPDTVIADISGLEQLFGDPSKIARDLARRCSDAGLEVHVAIAANPDAALHAARGYSGITILEIGREAERLGPLPLDVLVAPQYVSVPSKDKQTKQAREKALEMLDTLDRWGVRTLRGLTVLPEVAIVERLGQTGLQWWRFARGTTQRELVFAEPTLDFEETLELEYPVDLLEPLAFLLSRMLEQLCARLQSRALATHELRLRMQLDPDVTVDRDGLPISEAKSRSTNHEPHAFHERTIKLPVPMLDAKTFLKLLQLDLNANPPTAPVLKLWLRAEPVRPKFDQRGLFLPLTPEPQKLEITLARLTSVAGGQENVGSPEVLDKHRPDAFRMMRFAPPSPNYEKAQQGQKTLRPMSALRRFRPPQPVSMLMSGDKPIAMGPPRSMASLREITQTLYGDIVWCAGPWRTSGEWWNHERWEREEWDVAVIQGSGNGEQRLESSGRWAVNDRLMHSHSLSPNPKSLLYRVYRDLLAGTWFVEGEYD